MAQRLRPNPITGNKLGTTVDELKDILDVPPRKHDDPTDKYGPASETNYGHAQAGSPHNTVIGVANVAQSLKYARVDHSHTLAQGVELPGWVAQATNALHSDQTLKLENSITFKVTDTITAGNAATHETTTVTNFDSSVQSGVVTITIPNPLNIDITGNAATATKLNSASAKKINNTTFDGSKDITTAIWGTTRKFSIASYDGSNPGATENVNGSSAITLLLPKTITGEFVGNLSGTADAAKKTSTTTSLQVNLASTKSASFDGSETTTIEPGVKGTLALGNGGTGATSADAARHNLAATKMFVQTSAPTSSLGVKGDICVVYHTS